MTGLGVGFIPLPILILIAAGPTRGGELIVLVPAILAFAFGLTAPGLGGWAGMVVGAPVAWWAIPLLGSGLGWSAEAVLASAFQVTIESVSLGAAELFAWALRKARRA